MITFIKKDNSQFEYNKADMKKVKIYETFIKLTTHNNHDITIDLSMLKSIEIENENLCLFVFTGEVYEQEMKVDYEQFCDLSEEVPYEDLDEDSSWSAKAVKDRKFIVCDGELEIYNELKYINYQIL